MTSKYYLAVFALLTVALGGNAADTKPDPASLVRAANEVSDLSRARPYQLTGIVVLNPGVKDESRGTITVYRDRDQYRSDIELSGKRRIWVKLGNKIYVSNPTPLAFFGLEQLRDIENAWRESQVNTSETKFSHATHKKALGPAVWCVTENYRDYVPVNLCFDTALGVMVRTGYGDDRYEFSDFQTLAGQKYPGNIRRFRSGKLVLEVRNLRAQPGPVPQNAFQTPEGAREFEYCENMVEAKLQTSGDLLPRNPVAAGEWMKVFIYGIVNEDGTLTDLKVASLPRNPAIVKFVEEVAAKRRYSPAMCGAKPVATEISTEIEAQAH
jgi:hypothetical protein